MQVVTLGTGSPIPDPNRAGPATLVRAGGRDFLFDCGRGVLMRAAGTFSGPAAFAVVFLTHLHSDHTTDLNDIITMRWAMSPAENPLPVVGPVGTAGLVEKTLAMLDTDISYRLAHHADLNWQPPVEVTEVEDGEVYNAGGVRILAAPTDHAPVHPTVGYRIEADGQVVVIAGDTVPCEGLDRLCQGADVYVQTVIHRTVVESVPMPRFQDILDYHSDIAQAASTAQRAGVRKLVMTHMVPAPQPGAADEWVDIAAAHFSGDIVVAEDLMTIEV
jgi:ribonuclease Z